jgi:antitoxin YobK
MTMRDYEAARDLLEQHSERAEFAGPRSPQLIERAETVLGVRFPPTYRTFLLEFGAGSFGGTEIYGVIDDEFEDSSIPDGVWNALEHRRNETLPGHLFEFHAPGHGEAICLDFSAAGDEAPVVSAWPGSNGKTQILFDDFGAWLMEAVEDELDVDDDL